jgi:hypothetical protein
MITQMLFTLFCTVAFCLGLYITSRDGYLLDFLQHPFIKAEYYRDVYTVRATTETTSSKFKYTFLAVICGLVEDLGPPFVMCITCMGSFWGATWFIILNGFSFHLLPYLIINCFAAAFIQTFIWKLYDKFIL